MADSQFIFVLLALSFSAFIKGSLGLGFFNYLLSDFGKRYRAQDSDLDCRFAFSFI